MFISRSSILLKVSPYERKLMAGNLCHFPVLVGVEIGYLIS
jgi:hypothetical protein